MKEEPSFVKIFLLEGGVSERRLPVRPSEAVGRPRNGLARGARETRTPVAGCSWRLVPSHVLCLPGLARPPPMWLLCRLLSTPHPKHTLQRAHVCAEKRVHCRGSLSFLARGCARLRAFCVVPSTGRVGALHVVGAAVCVCMSHGSQASGPGVTGDRSSSGCCLPSESSPWFRVHPRSRHEPCKVCVSLCQRID